MTVRELIIAQYSMILDRKITRLIKLETGSGDVRRMEKEQRERDLLLSVIQSGKLLPNFTTKYGEVIDEEVDTWVNSMLYVRNQGGSNALYVKTASGEYVYSYSSNTLTIAPFPFEHLESNDFLDKGMVHIYYGDGEGITAAAFGLAYRVMGYGRKVIAAQFLKGRETGETRSASDNPNITIIKGMESDKFPFQMTQSELEALTDYTLKIFDDAAELSQNPDIRLLILDSVLDACDLELLPVNVLTDFLYRKRGGLEVALTGTSLPKTVEPYGDYITHFRKRRHPFDRGIKARQEIDY